MSVSDQTTPQNSPTEMEEEELNDFDVHLIVPVRSVDPIDAVDAMLAECIDFGMRSYIFRVRDRVTDARWYVGPEGILSDAEIDDIARQASEANGSDESAA